MVLTHFSQRYPKIPGVEALLKARNCVVAFDLMTVKFAHLNWLPKLIPALHCIFPEEERPEEEEEEKEEDNKGKKKKKPKNAEKGKKEKKEKKEKKGGCSTGKEKQKWNAKKRKANSAVNESDTSGASVGVVHADKKSKGGAQEGAS